MEKMKELYEWAVTWDRYVQKSNKGSTREENTQCDRRKVKARRCISNKDSSEDTSHE
jgi:hypothetical protein